MAGGVVPGLPWGDAASHVGLKHTSRTVDFVEDLGGSHDRRCGLRAGDR